MVDDESYPGYLFWQVLFFCASRIWFIVNDVNIIVMAGEVPRSTAEFEFEKSEFRCLKFWIDSSAQLGSSNWKSRNDFLKKNSKVKVQLENRGHRYLWKLSRLEVLYWTFASAEPPRHIWTFSQPQPRVQHNCPVNILLPLFLYVLHGLTHLGSSPSFCYWRCLKEGEENTARAKRLGL